MSSASHDVIRAAGVVLTRGVGKDLEVAVIHRRRRRDWSLPKGKFEAGEHAIETAVRETVEETGFTPVLDVPLPTQHYRVDGAPKTVEYWRASVVRGEFAENKEVDRLRWLRPKEAAAVDDLPARRPADRPGHPDPTHDPLRPAATHQRGEAGGLGPAHRTGPFGPGPGPARPR